jgi:hypothetical protein
VPVHFREYPAQIPDTKGTAMIRSWSLLAGIPAALEPAPIDMKGNHTLATVWLALMIATFVAALVYGGWRVIRHRDVLALTLILSGAISCVACEVVLDLVGMVWYPTDTGPFAFTMFGRSLPLWVVFGYGWYYGAASYLLYRGLTRGWKLGKVMWFVAAEAVLDWAMESTLIPLGLYRYYGPQPFNFYGFPFWWMIPNAAVSVIGGVLVYLARPYLQGWRMLAALAIVPAADAAVYFGANWPTFSTLNTDVPAVIRSIGAALGTGLTLLAVWAAVSLAKKIDRLDGPEAPPLRTENVVRIPG